MIFFRYLATGMSFRGLSHSFRLGVTIVTLCVHDTCAAICEMLGPIHLPVPTQTQLEDAARKMFEKWNFPNCVEAVDGKHVRIQCPPHSGTMFFNYKKFYSISFLVVADANYKFLTIDIGACGKHPDGGTFKESNLFREIMNVEHKWPKARELPGTSIHSPFVLVGDEAFPIIENLMWPFPGLSLPVDKMTFNKRLSRSRTVVERAFRISTTK